MTESEHKIIEILRILNEQNKPTGSKLIAEELKNKGFNLGERAVRYHMQILDEKGYTERMGYSGRQITELGRKKHRIKTLTGLGFQTGSVFWFVVFQRFFPEAAERKRRTIWSIFAASCLDFPALMAEMIRSASEAENCAPP